jgi:hypothetical protein
METIDHGDVPGSASRKKRWLYHFFLLCFYYSKLFSQWSYLDLFVLVGALIIDEEVVLKDT